MKVLIFGLNTVEEIDKVINFLINKGEIPMLFTLVTGGIRGQEKENATAAWEKKNGCPLEYAMYDNPAQLISSLGRRADYLVMRAQTGLPQWQKNLMMQMKSEGKHGYVIR